jgi:Cytochrome c oxidase subunit IV
MAPEIDQEERPVPPPGEAVHLPEPSYLPVLTALGIALALVGLVISWVIVGIGVVLTLVVVIRWIRQTRGEISELPLEH